MDLFPQTKTGAPSAATGLLISPQANAPLTPDQKKYNQLVQKIDKLRAKLLAWETAMPAFAAAHQARMTPLIQALANSRLLLAKRLGELLGTKGLSAVERETMSRALCELAAMLVNSDFMSEADVAQLTDLHDQYARVSLEQQNQAGLEDMKGYVEHMSGLDLGDQAFESPEDLMHHARERLAAEIEAREREDAGAPAKSAKPVKPPTAAQRKRAKKAEQAAAAKQAKEQAASQSLREIYRKLVSALHPDRATDEADRSQRTALMQRVNRAYEGNDLLGLFALQLEIEQVDPEHLAQASAERVRHYNQVLATQARELQGELEQRETVFAMDFGIIDHGDLRPANMGWVLDTAVREIELVIKECAFEYARLGTPAGLKSWLKQTRREQRQDDIDPFGGYF